MQWQLVIHSWEISQPGWLGLSYGGCEVKSNISQEYWWSRRKAFCGVLTWVFIAIAPSLPPSSLLVFLPLHHNARKTPTVAPTYISSWARTLASMMYLPLQLSCCFCSLCSNLPSYISHNLHISISAFLSNYPCACTCYMYVYVVTCYILLNAHINFSPSSPCFACTRLSLRHVRHAHCTQCFMLLHLHITILLLPR